MEVSKRNPDELLKHKFTYDEVEKIFFKNVLRLYKELL